MSLLRHVDWLEIRRKTCVMCIIKGCGRRRKGRRVNGDLKGVAKRRRVKGRSW